MAGGLPNIASLTARTSDVVDDKGHHSLRLDTGLGLGLGQVRINSNPDHNTCWWIVF